MDAITQVNVHFNVRFFVCFFLCVCIMHVHLRQWKSSLRASSYERGWLDWPGFQDLGTSLILWKNLDVRVNMGRWSGSVPEIFPIWTLWLGYWDEFSPTTRVTDLAAGGARPQTTWTAMAASEQISSSSKSKTFCQRRDMISNLIECLNDFKSKIE